MRYIINTKITVELSVYDWHVLLDELLHSQRFVNRDTENASRLYEEIAKQLR